MPTITFLPSEKTIDVPVGTELLDAARRAGVEIASPCGGKGTCGKCIVKIISGGVDSESIGILPRAALIDGFVAACRTKALGSHIVVEVPEQLGRQGGKFTNASEDTRLIRAELLPHDWQYDPQAVKWCVDVPAPQMGDGLSDLERLTRRIQLDWGRQEVIYPLSVIRQVADTLRANSHITVTIIREPGALRVIAMEAGDRTIRHYGIAVDVGTTTIAVQIVFLPTAQIVTTLVDYNDQVTCGLDVISRINYARRPERREELRTRVLGTINRLIGTASESYEIDRSEICSAVVSGNTTMTHLMLGLNPEYIRLEPYTPTLLQGTYFTAAETGLEINPESRIYFSPSVGSYVGGDITAGLLCTDIAIESEGVCLFIDIGTNGEIVVGNNEFLMTCACSAGPAFEGGGIDCGMRAALGAIERVEIDPETGGADYATIGNVRPKGICGSGMISLLASLFLTGWIDAAGKLRRDKESPFVLVEGRTARYLLVTAEESATGKPLTITETDIDNIIRAKAAIYSACGLMLQQVGITFDDLSSVYIAGGFGRFLDLENAKVIGLVPDLPAEKFHYIGNSSLMGSYMVLVSQEYREKQVELARRMTYVDLSSEPTYMDQYTGALFLPHTDPDLFPSVKAMKAKGCSETKTR